MANTAQPHSAPAGDEHNSNFIKTFIGVFAFLVIFTLFCMFVARQLSTAVGGETDSLLRNAMIERIEPVGKVRTTADPAAIVAAAEVPSGPKSGGDIVQSACAACHLSGAAGAPKIDDAEAWATRRESGLDALVASVINGKGAMPPRAGTSLSDEELTLAVQHLAGFVSDEDSSAEATSTEVATPAASSSATETATETAAAESTAVVAAAPELSDRVKGVVDSLCIGCHIAGVAGAPKIGDTAVWAEKAEKGLEAQVAIVAAGKGAMPPRGGSDLSDDELGAAIVYLMSK